jgi:hypothetical protein
VELNDLVWDLVCVAKCGADGLRVAREEVEAVKTTYILLLL